MVRHRPGMGFGPVAELLDVRQQAMEAMSEAGLAPGGDFDCVSIELEVWGLQVDRVPDTAATTVLQCAVQEVELPPILLRQLGDSVERRSSSRPAALMG